MRTGPKRVSQEDQTQIIENFKKELIFMPEPTLFYEKGQKVYVGALKNCIIEDVLCDGKGYIIKSQSTNNNDKEHLFVCKPWMDIRSGEFGNTNFTKNEDIRLNFCNSTIESMLFRVYHSGVDFDPEYQRDFVWDSEDKEMLIDSIFFNADIGKLIYANREDYSYGSKVYEIVDGKQRLMTMAQFYENRFSYKGYFFKDLSAKDRRTFLDHNIVYADIRNASETDILQIFLMVNRGGKALDKKHLEKVEKLYMEKLKEK